MECGVEGRRYFRKSKNNKTVLVKKVVVLLDMVEQCNCGDRVESK